jgi:hypothetical protein
VGWLVPERPEKKSADGGQQTADFFHSSFFIFHFLLFLQSKKLKLWKIVVL